MEVMIKEGNWVNPQIKDHFYDQFLKEPTKDNFRDFMKKSCGELNEMDFKETWIDKGPLAKIMLAMANNGGGIIVGSLLIFFFIYGIYWIATYIGFKRNINEES